MADNWRQNPNQTNSPKSREESRRQTPSGQQQSPRQSPAQSPGVVYEGDLQLDLSTYSPTAFSRELSRLPIQTPSPLQQSPLQSPAQSPYGITIIGDPQLDLGLISPTAFVEPPVSPVRVGSPFEDTSQLFIPPYQPVSPTDELAQHMQRVEIGDRPQLPGLDYIDWKLTQGMCIFDSRIGGGRFGQVYEGWSNRTTDKVAIKVQKVSTPGHVVIQGLREEQIVCDILKHYGHKNILNIIDIRLNSNRLYIVSELSPIGDLHQYMQVTNAQNEKVWQPLDIYEAWHLGHGIAEGVAHLHHLMIAHGDIKPENILLFPNPNAKAIDSRMPNKCYDTFIAKLTDFGNAAIQLESHPTGKILCDYPKCTIPYAAPESWRYKPEFEPQSGMMFSRIVHEYDCLPADCYSVGCCLIAMVLGCQPFQLSNDLLTDIKATEVPLSPFWGQTNNMQKDNKFIVGLKQNQTYLKSMVKPLPVTLRSLLTNLLDPRPESRMTIDQILDDPWMVRPDLKTFEDSHQRKPYQLSRKERFQREI